MEIRALPILSIRGATGSGKTTLIEQCLPPLRDRGLKVAVAKQDQKSIASDGPGKESARFFAAGADCLLMGGDGLFFSKHPSVGTDFGAELLALASQHDLVLVEGHPLPGPKVWLLGDEESGPGVEAEVIATLARGPDRLPAMVAIIDDFLAQQWLKPPVVGCVLIGGRSSRMGRPKHLLIKEGKTWLERTAAALSEVTDQVVVVGGGEVRECPWPRLPDVPGIFGPLAGLLAVMRWQPWATLLVTACDLPDLSVDALRWLLDQRTPGAWAVIPTLGSYHEPLLALYDFRIRPTLEAMAHRHELRVSGLVGAEGVRVVSPPSELRGSWRNVNSPEEIESKPEGRE